MFSLSAAPPLVPTIRRGPAYPLFLALFGAAARAAQCALDALVAAMICFLAGRPRGWWAGGLYALHPGAIVYANSILSECLFAFLLAATVALLVIAVRRDDWRWAVVAGVGIGMAALCRPVAAPLVIVIALVPRRRRIAAVFCAAAVVVVAPWIVRSSILAGRFVLVSSTAPVNVALATTKGPWNLNDQATIFRGRYYWDVDPCGRATSHAQSPREAAQADGICAREALDNLRRDPGHYARTRPQQQLMHFPSSSGASAKSAYKRGRSKTVSPPRCGSARS